MSDYGGEYDPDEEARAYSADDFGVAALPMASTPAPAPAPPPPPPVQRSGPRRALAGLGDFAPDGRCVVTALAKLLWRFYSQVADGATMDALTTLNVYRSLYNLKRSALVPGYSPTVQLPLSIPDASWSQATLDSAKLVLIGAYGSGDSAILSALRAMPTSMAGIPAWLPSLRAASSPEDLQALRAYLETPMPSGADVARTLASYVADDLRVCQGIVPTSPTPPAPTPAPQYVAHPPAPRNASAVVYQGGGAGAGSGARPPTPAAAPSGGIGILGVVLLGLVGYGAWLAYKDGEAARLESLEPPEPYKPKPHRELMRAAKALARPR